MRLFTLGLLALLACACTPQCTSTPHSSPTPSACSAAGAKLRELNCPQATTPAGTPFEAACQRALDDGRNWRPDCIARVTSCDQVEAAYRTPTKEACQ